MPPDADQAVQILQLWITLAGFQCRTGTEDHFSWPCSPSDQFSVKGTYDMLCHGRVRIATAACVWKSKASLKCKIFSWLALQHRVWTSDRRLRPRLQTATSNCFSCLQDEDTIKHALVICVYARETWHGCVQRLGIATQVPVHTDRLEPWWLRERKGFNSKDRRLFDTFIIATCFNNPNRQVTVQVLIGRILDELRTWLNVGPGVGDLNPD